MGLSPSDAGAQAELATFRQRLAALGWIEGRNIHLEFRWPGGDIALARTFAKELVASNPDLLMGRSTPTTAALKQETSTIPIVFVNVAEPLESGFVQSLARPGGNITGFTNFEGSIGGKWLQLLKECDPRITRVAVIYNPQTAPFAGAFVRSVQSAAPMFAVEIVAMPVGSEAEIAAALTAFSQQPGAGLVAIPDSFTVEHRQKIISSVRAGPPACALRESRCHAGRRARSLRCRHAHFVPPCSVLCRPHPQGRKAQRASG